MESALIWPLIWLLIVVVLRDIYADMIRALGTALAELSRAVMRLLHAA